MLSKDYLKKELGDLKAIVIALCRGQGSLSDYLLIVASMTFGFSLCSLLIF